MQHIIKSDPDVGHQRLKSIDFDLNDTRSAEELSFVWKRVKNICISARDCKDNGKDENAWCDKVVRPSIQLAIELHGKDKWQIQNLYVPEFSYVQLINLIIQSVAVYKSSLPVHDSRYLGAFGPLQTCRPQNRLRALLLAPPP